MTAEALHRTETQVPLQSRPALGALAIAASQEARPADSLVFRTLPKQEEPLSTRARALTATLVKEKFQSIPTGLRADQRDEVRAQLRMDGMRMIFKAVGALENDATYDEVFATEYAKAESDVTDMDRDRLLDLLDKYESHPAMQIIDTLAATSPLKDDLVYMRRTGLVLLADHSA